MPARRFDPAWYASVMKRTQAMVLACGPPGSGVRLWTRRRLLGHRDDEVLADRAMSALSFAAPAVGPGDDPVAKAEEAKNAAVRRRLEEIRRFAAGAPVVLNWTTRDIGTDPARYDAEGLGLPAALLDGVDVVLYVARDGHINDDPARCFVLKDAYSAEPRV